MNSPIAAAPSAWAQGLGYAGLIPFVFLALATWFTGPGPRELAGQALIGYGAVIASFLGAIHWGLVLRDRSLQSLPTLGWGVLPSLLAWGALMLSPSAGLLAIAGVLWACFALDRLVYARFETQSWLPLRLTLTCVASASCIVAASRL